MRVRRPQLAAVDAKTAVDLHCARARPRKVGAGIRLAHADAERQVAACDPREEVILLLVGAIAQDVRAALAIGGPMEADGCAGGEHLLDQHVAFERGAFVAAVFLGPGHADPAALGHLAGERLVVVAAVAKRGAVLVRNARTSLRSAFAAGGSSTGSKRKAWNVIGATCPQCAAATIAYAGRRSTPPRQGKFCLAQCGEAM